MDLSKHVLVMLLLVLLVSSRLRAGDSDARVEQAIKALGGSVVRDHKAPGKPIIGIVGGGSEDGVAVNRVTDAVLTELRGLQSLQTLDLTDAQVTDAGLKELGGLKNLRELYLSETQVTDAGLNRRLKLHLTERQQRVEFLKSI